MSRFPTELDFDALVARETSPFRRNTFLPPDDQMPPESPAHQEQVQSQPDVLVKLEEILRDRKLLGPEKSIRDLTGEDVSTPSEMVIANLIKLISEAHQPDLAAMRRLIEKRVNAAKYFIPLDTGDFGYIRAEVAGNTKIIEKINTLADTFFNRNGNEVELLFSTEEVSITDGRTGLIISDVMLTNHGDANKVNQYAKPLEPGQVLAHTHTSRNKIFLDTISTGDILAALDTNEWVNSKGEKFTGLHRFAVVSCHEGKGLFAVGHPAHVSIQLYQVSLLDMQILQKYGRWPVLKVGKPFVIELK